MTTLYVASRDIGNYKDNTYRLKEILEKSDTIFVESFKEATSLLKYFSIKKDNKNLIELSEHTKDIYSIVQNIKDSQTALMMSDCGTPLLEDPGKILVSYCYENNIKVSPVPGVSSVTAAIMSLPFNFKEFYYGGLLPREDREREKKLVFFKKLNVPVIILDTPYRIGKVLNAVNKIYSFKRRVGLCLDITTEKEEIIVGCIGDIVKKYQDNKKREFVLVIDNL